MKADLYIYFSLLLILFTEVDFSPIPIDLNLRRVSLIAIAIINLIALIKLKKGKIIIDLSNKMLISLLVYYVLIVVSLTWSVNSAESFTSIVGITICFSTSFLIAYLHDYHKILQYLIFIVAVLLAISLFSLLVSDYADNKEAFFRLKGVFVHSQRLSLILSISIIITYIKYLNSKNRKLLLILLGFIFALILTKTRSFTTFLLLTISAHYIHTNKKYHYILILFVGMIALYAFGAVDFLFDIYQRDNREFIQLTGRTPLWLAVVEKISQKPLFGYGFGVFKLQPIGPLNWFPEHAHNLWLHQVYETGIITMLVFNIFLVYSFVVSNIHEKMYGYSYAKYILIFIFFSSFTGLVLGGLATPIYFLMLIITFSEYRRCKLHGFTVRLNTKKLIAQ